MSLWTCLTTRDGPRSDLLIGMLACFVLAVLFGLAAYGLSGGALAAQRDLEARADETYGRMHKNLQTTIMLLGVPALLAAVLSGVCTLVGLWCGSIAAFGREKNPLGPAD